MTLSRSTAYLALGSNVGDRDANLAGAIGALRSTPGIQITKMSRFIETEAVGLPDQDSFLNAAMEVQTTLSARELLERCLEIERLHGRVREPSVRWGPRTLDIDILLFADQVIDEPGLHIPHPRMHERSFVLSPLAEIAPGAVHPVLGQTIQCLLRRVSPTSKPEYERGERCSFR